ncbi:hypothetical protein BOX24_12040 [Leptospirillum ferriphilum]|uniref:Uncharacterized protein n=2 Tax=Leptospirillum ferriphilum TaxID=178606 RepID=A0A1V3STR5_9BACT|nr:hypothetical protein LFML04_0295 [Leptospirillum ferriphilum ML-04]OOH69740.1 hypothetical protein BOX24_12040 [Leptospirillum ferriphilum]
MRPEQIFSCLFRTLPFSSVPFFKTNPLSRNQSFRMPGGEKVCRNVDCLGGYRPRERFARFRGREKKNAKFSEKNERRLPMLSKVPGDGVLDTVLTRGPGSVDSLRA